MSPETAKTSLPSAPDHRPRGEPRTSRRGPWRALVLVLVHLVALAHVLHWLTAGETLSPVEPSEAWETLTYGTVNAGFVLLVLTLIATLVVGRFFCGWACHVVAYQDACAWLLGKLGLRPKPIRSRLLALVPAYAAIDIFLLPVLARWSGAEPGAWSLTWATSTDALWETFPGLWMALATLLVDGFLVVWFFGSKGFCTYGCPYGALFGVADRAAPGRIRVSDACEGCGHCTAACTSNVAVHAEVARHGMVVDPGCMRCLDCVSVCPKDALSFGFGAPASADEGAPARPKRARAQRHWDFSWPEELLLAAVFAGAVFAFRNLYGAVPFLLAVGLGVIAALCAVVPLRLLRASELSFQHLELRREGRLTGAGLACLVAMPLVLVFAGHSGAVQVEHRRAIHWNKVAAAAQGDEASFALAARQALDRLGKVERWSLVPTAEVHNRQGQLLAALGELEAAEEQLRRALELAPETATARTSLAEVLARKQEPAGARDAYLEALALDPGQARAAAGLIGLLVRHADQREPVVEVLSDRWLAQGQAEPGYGQPRARALATRLAEALVTTGQLDLALPHLEGVLDADPGDLAARRCLAALLRGAPDHPRASALAARLGPHDPTP